MSLGLPGLPSETLAEITSYLSDWDNIVRLVLCGHSLLTNKIKSGGVKRVHLDKENTCSGALKLVKTLRLERLSLSGPWTCSSTSELYSDSIQHLWISTRYQDQLVESDTLNLKLSPTGVCSSAYLPWNVSATFPSLKSLHIDAGYDNWEDEFDAHFWNSFLSMLPPSLTSLSLPRLLVSDWTSLPPHLTSLKGLVGIFPLSDSLMNSLVELDLHLDSLPYDALAIDTATYQAEQELTCCNIANLTFPPHLTSLTLRWKTKFRFPLNVLPSSLTMLSWCAEDSYCPISLQTILAATPATVTHLAISTTLHATEDVTDQRFQLPLAKTLLLQPRETASHLAPQLYKTILQTMPNLETLEVSGDGDWVLGADHVSSLSPHLTTLIASLHLSYFTSVNGVYPLTMFNKLAYLDVAASVLETEFDFACLPPSITTLHLGAVPITTTTISSTPSNIRTLTGIATVSGNSENFQSLFLGPSLPRVTGSTSDSKSTCPEALLLYQPCDMVDKPFCCYTQAVFSQLAVPGPNGLDFHPHLATIDPDEEIFGFSLQWTSLETLSSSLTALKVPSMIGLQGLSPALLRNLVSLELELAVPQQMDLGDLVKLRTLKVDRLDYKCVSRCPPNLTRLHLDIADLKASFLPLPTTLTSFTFNGQLLPGVEVVNSLPHLEEFGTTDRPSDAVLAFAKTSRPTIKTLMVADAPSQDSFVEDLVVNFPSLETLHIAGETSYRTIMELSALYSHRLVIKGGNVRDDLEDLFLSPNLRSTIVNLDDDGTFLRHIDRLWHCAMPNWSYGSITDSSLAFNDDTWSAFASMISPDASSLAITRIENLSPDWVLKLPKNITQLEIGRWPSGTRLELPSTLRTLYALLVGDCNDLFASLPTGLTKLIVGAPKSLLSENLARALPPSLTSLTVYMKVDDQGLSALPPSVVRLYLPQHVLTRSNLNALPSGVRFFQGFPSRGCSKVLLSEDYTGTVTWTAETVITNCARRILAMEPDVEESPSDSFVRRLKELYP